jgi:hypothetical protein
MKTLSPVSRCSGRFPAEMNTRATLEEQHFLRNGEVYIPC